MRLLDYREVTVLTTVDNQQIRINPNARMVSIHIDPGNTTASMLLFGEDMDSTFAITGVAAADSPWAAAPGFITIDGPLGYIEVTDDTDTGNNIKLCIREFGD